MLFKKEQKIYLIKLNIKFKWKGKGIKTKCYDSAGNCIVECDKTYYRPLEVDTLLGNSNKAKRDLKWKPKINFDKLISEMVESDLKLIK